MGARKQKWEEPPTSQDTHVPAFHVWSNFEIADLDFWCGEAYTKSFDYLDAKGVSWVLIRIPCSFLRVPISRADNTVHSIAVALSARKRPDGMYLLLPPPICDASIIIAALLRQYRCRSNLPSPKPDVFAGYRHEPFQYCPQGATHSTGKCECDMADNFDLSSSYIVAC